uniref:Uncharacterized protein n=1 Tax=Myripristis murdjan TaxID=586833 RepID=A0A668AD89_9TELE
MWVCESSPFVDKCFEEKPHDEFFIPGPLISQFPKQSTVNRVGGKIVFQDLKALPALTPGGLQAPV